MDINHVVTHNTSLEQAVASLRVALQSAENRTARLERLIRWGATIFVVFLGMLPMLAYKPSGLAFAQVESGVIPPSQAPQIDPQNDFKRAIDALENIGKKLDSIDKKLAIFGQTEQLVGEFKNSVQQAIMKNDDAWALIESNHKDCKDKLISKEECMMKYAMSDIIGSMVDTTANVMVLVGRVRGDSNLIHEFVGRLNGSLLEGIKSELRLMNTALASVPVMAIQMDAMTRQMGAMTYSIGSTMGRVGSWMP
jgi:hypothetical protein